MSARNRLFGFDRERERIRRGECELYVENREVKVLVKMMLTFCKEFN